MIVEVTSRRAYYKFEERLRKAGFREEGQVICRWLHGEGLVLDAMAAEASILGFENRWQREPLPWTVERELPSGARIRVVPPAYLLATKLEACPEARRDLSQETARGSRRRASREVF